MSLLGVYPFTVNVANVFAPGQHVDVKVIHYHRLGYFTGDEENNKEFVIKPIQPADPATIPGGYRLGFPMLMGDEYLEISLATSEQSEIPSKYFTQAGLKAQAKVMINNEKEKPEQGTYLDLDLKDDFYGGGLWEMTADDGTDWVLTIKKYGGDPATDDVVVGPGTPG